MARLTAEGVREEFYYEQDNSQPTRVFAFTDRLLTIHGARLPANRVWEGSRDRGEHTIADVRLGDRVCISYHTVRGEERCYHLSIQRRPGGRVPDAHGDDDPAYKMKVSTERNFSQFTEETIAGKWGPRLLSAFRRR